MADFKCPFAVATGTTGLYKCTKQTAEKPPAAKGKKKGAANTAANPPQTGPQYCGHQRYCPTRKRCILTEQAAKCPKREE